MKHKHTHTHVFPALPSSAKTTVLLRYKQCIFYDKALNLRFPMCDMRCLDWDMAQKDLYHLGGFQLKVIEP